MFFEAIQSSEGREREAMSWIQSSIINIQINKEQRAKNKEQRTKSKEQRAKNKEQRAKSKEQRAKNTEQRAKNKEQRTKSKATCDSSMWYRDGTVKN